MTDNTHDDTLEPSHASPPRRDLAIRLADRPGALAEMGEVLGRAGVSLEGGGGFVSAAVRLLRRPQKPGALRRVLKPRRSLS